MNPDPKKLRIVLLGAGYTTQNMGVWALASGAVISLLHRFPEAGASLVDYARAEQIHTLALDGRSVPVPLYPLRYSWRIWLPNHVVRLFARARSVRRQNTARSEMAREEPSALHALCHADVVGALAGGDSFSDLYGANRLWYVTLPALLAMALGRPLVLLPQTIGPFRRAWSRRLAAQVLPRARRVYVRDRSSMELARQLAPEAGDRIRFCHDLAFALEPHLPAERRPPWLISDRPRAPRIGFNISGLLHMGGYNRRNMFGLADDYRRLVADLIRDWAGARGCEVVLVPHVWGARNPESDETACAEVEAGLDPDVRARVRRVEGPRDERELKAIIGSCDFFLGSRMHACIAALSQGIPAVGLAYSGKFESLFETVGVKELALDLRRCSNEEVRSAAARLFDQRELYRARLADHVPVARREIAALWDDVASIAAEASA